MGNKYVDNLHPSAVDDLTSGSTSQPYLTLAYAESQCSDGDVLYVGNATTYDIGDGTAFTIDTAITLVNWANRSGSKPRIEGGDASRLIYVNEAGSVVIDGFTIVNDRTGNGAYILQAHSTVRDLRIRNCDFSGSVTLSAVGITSGASGIIIESTCNINMTLGGATYAGATGAVECYANVTLYGSAQAAHFISNGDSNGADFVYGGIQRLYTTNNYVVRCGATNSDADITIDGSFNLAEVPSNYSRATFDIQDPRTFTVNSGAKIDTTKSQSVTDAEVWVRAKTGVSGAVNINALEVNRGSLAGYIIKIGDESPFSESHVPNSFTQVNISNCILKDGTEFGSSGTTQTHMIFIGNENNHKVTGNHVYGGAYGIGIKGDDTAASDSYVNGNVLIGQRLAHLKTKGIDHTQWFNNFVLENGRGGTGIDLTVNTDDGAAGTGNAAKVKNNTFIMDTEVALFIDTNSNLGDNDIDFNAYYHPSTVAISNLSGVNYQTLSDLQSELDVDLNSYEKTGTPSYDAEYKPKTTSNEYRAGIAVSSLTPINIKSNVVGISDATLAANTAIRVDSPGMRRSII